MLEEDVKALQAAIDRWMAGNSSEEDLRLIQRAWLSGQLAIQTPSQGKSTGSIQGDEIQASNSQGFLNRPSGPVTQTFILNVTDAQAKDLFARLRQYSPPELLKLDELPDSSTLLPPGTRLPFPPNAAFTGREEDLLTLGRFLLHREGRPVGIVQAAAATGTGGIGKTQLAVEFCYRYGRYFQGVHWIQANLDIPAEIATCGFEMGLQPWPETLPEQVQATLLAWEQNIRRLIVLDNIEEPAILQTWLPQMRQARLLLTSRKREWPADLGLALLPLNTLPRPESLALLRKLAQRLENISEDELDPIAEQLGDLPLALDLAGRYLQDRKTLSPAGFLAELAAEGGALKHSALKDWAKHNPTNHEANLAATFLKGWERLERDSARQLFQACGYCAANTPIPWEVLVLITGEEGNQAEQEVDRDSKRLDDLGLVRLAETGMIVHPLLAEFARLQDQDAPTSALPDLAQAVGNLASQANKSGLPENFKPLRAHVQSTAQWVELAGLDSAGWLWNELGYHQKQVAEYAGARQAYERALRIDEAAFGPDHPNVAIRVNNLGLVLRALGDLAGARQAFERALAILEAFLPPDHPSIRIVRGNLESFGK